MPRPIKYRKLVKALRDYDSEFVINERRGKGSHRMISHPDINGRPEFYPVKCHGKNTELRLGTVSAIIRRFKLPKDIFD